MCSRAEQKFHCDVSAGPQVCVQRERCPAVVRKYFQIKLILLKYFQPISIKYFHSSEVEMYEILSQETNRDRRNSTIAELKSLVWLGCL